MAQHLIFEGAELAGKSWLMSQVYDFLESKYNQNKQVLDGCHWFNCDVGIFGTEKSQPVINHFNQIFKELSDKNVIVEKFFLSDIVYSRLHRNVEKDYRNIENELLKENFKIILCTFPEDKELLKKRIADRLNLYPHYARILQTPEWYIRQQRQYLEEIKKSCLPYLQIETTQLPDQLAVDKILNWIGEK
ncbi:MAG: hypothetical protein UT48_C0001G0053 [Parcubacteria group bacterium GW2011_GWE2_39_37]|uniref:Thymidylate kinase-like domain-containing protein n=1 Tax=Candidatus Falkowbacteria bacterium GW2011_GWF2_39_8 TaxID=1618642 RepID=A0A0G0Q8Z2_9BACT|nr:MAG: hypothetical protein UT48_C0001G0053 [Parcubacteria group bacterium GW2011_GWE2_39_37]KKR33796.1 MAG: hypothetical protein UT64_C0003G0017 [Candidatus Falkowbacteria bacterium GW2011_GWF2_39_8]